MSERSSYTPEGRPLVVRREQAAGSPSAAMARRLGASYSTSP